MPAVVNQVLGAAVMQPLSIHLASCNLCVCVCLHWKVPADEGPSLATIVQNHFNAVMVIKGKKKLKYHHRQSITSLNQ